MRYHNLIHFYNIWKVKKCGDHMVDWLLVVAWCLLNIRPHFNRTTKKRKSAIGSIEYTIKKES